MENPFDAVVVPTDGEPKVVDVEKALKEPNLETNGSSSGSSGSSQAETPHLLAHGAIEQAVSGGGEETEQAKPVQTVVVVNGETGANNNKKKKVSTKVDVDASVADDDEDDDEEANMTTVSIADESHATEQTTASNAGESQHGSVATERTSNRGFPSNSSSNQTKLHYTTMAAMATAQTATAAPDDASYDTEGAHVDATTDQSVYEYVVNAYNSSKHKDKMSFVDFYWHESEKQRQAAALQDPESPESVTDSQNETGTSEKPRKTRWICFLQVYVAFMVVACVAVGTVCGGFGLCTMKDSGNSSDESDSSAANNEGNAEDDVPALKKPFFGNFELRRAIDQYLEDPGTVPAVYGTDIAEWDVSQVTDFSHLFSAERNEAVSTFNADLSRWDVSLAENMESMFLGCEEFTGQGLGAWNVSRVTSLLGTFESCTSFDQDLSAWDVSNVEDFSFLFARSGFRGQGVAEWSTVSATNMSYTFFELPLFNADLSGWSTSRLVDMSYMVRAFKVSDGC